MSELIEAPKNSPYGIHLRPFTKDIAVGMLNKARDMFTGVQYDVTGVALRAVADYIKAGDERTITFGDGLVMKVEIIEPGAPNE